MKYGLYYKQNQMKQIKAFIMVVQHHTVTKAAQLMNVGVSSINNLIHSLERHLGVTLFQKQGRNIVLTHKGKRFYQTVLPIYNATEEMFNTFHKQEQHLKDIEVRIATNHVGVSYILPQYIKQMKEQYPKTNFYIHNIAKECADSKLLNGEVDIAVYPTTTQPPEFEFKPIRTHKPILLLRRDDILLERKKISDIIMEDVQDRELVRIDPNLITLPNFEQVIQNYKLKTSFTFENADWEILKAFVRAKIGVALISDICLHKNDPDLIAIPMTKYFGEMTYSLYTNKTLKLRDIIQQFINIIYAA